MPERITITDWSQVPQFTSEQEEYAFWDKHVPADGLVSSSPPDDEEAARVAAERATIAKEQNDVASGTVAKSRTVSFRVEPDVLERLKVMADHKGMPYQALLKRFVIERLYEEERRAGVFGTPPAA